VLPLKRTRRLDKTDQVIRLLLGLKKLVCESIAKTGRGKEISHLHGAKAEKGRPCKPYDLPAPNPSGYSLISHLREDVRKKKAPLPDTKQQEKTGRQESRGERGDIDGILQKGQPKILSFLPDKTPNLIPLRLSTSIIQEEPRTKEKTSEKSTGTLCHTKMTVPPRKRKKSNKKTR